MDNRIDAPINGAIAELNVISKLLKNGFNVFKPILDISGTDIIVTKDDKIYRCQIKSSNTTNKCGGFQLRTSKGRHPNIESYTKKHTDYILGYIPIHDTLYIIPVEVLYQKLQIDVYPNNKSIKIKNNYEIFKDNFGFHLSDKVFEYNEIIANKRNLAGKLHSQGKTKKEIAIELNMGTSTINRWLLDDGFIINKILPSKEELIILYNKLNQKKLVAKQLKLSIYIINKLFKKYNIDTKPEYNTKPQR